MSAVTAVFLGWDATVVTVVAGLEMAAAEVMFSRGLFSARWLLIRSRCCRGGFP